MLNQQGVHKPMPNGIPSGATPLSSNRNMTSFSFTGFSFNASHKPTSPTDPSSLFSARFWSHPDHKMLIPSFNSSILHLGDLSNENQEAMQINEQQHYYKIPRQRSPFLISPHTQHSSPNRNLTPQLFLPKLNSNTKHQEHYASVTNPTDVHHSNTNDACCSSIIQYFQELIRNKSIYNPSLQHAWDVATDIAVLLKWGKHAFGGMDIEHIDFVPLFCTSLFVQLGYRLVSCYAVYQSEKSISRAMLQACDLLMLREIYVSHIECRCTDTLVYLKKLEAVLEAAPQLILTTYFFLRVGTLEKSQTEIIGWLWSFFTLSTKVINDDSKMYKHIKSRWDKQFMYRFLFRLFEICSRVLILGLIAIAISARAAMAITVLDLSLLLLSYYYGLLNNDIMNVLGSLITFVDLTIYPKVSPLFWWYGTIQNLQRVHKPVYNEPVPDHSCMESLDTIDIKSTMFDLGIFRKNDDKSAMQSLSSSNKKIHLTSENSVEFKEDEKDESKENEDKSISDTAGTDSKQNPLIASLKISMDEIRPSPSGIQLKVATNGDTDHEGLRSVRERSSMWLKELSDIEAVYLKLQAEETINAKYIQYRCCGCCCWMRLCNGFIPQCIVRNFIDKCYLLVSCMSWVLCIYWCGFILCQWDNRRRKPVKHRLNILEEIENEEAGISEIKLLNEDLESLNAKKSKKEKKPNKAPKDEDGVTERSKSEDSAPVVANVITDRQSVQKMVDFAQQKNSDDEELSSEEPPDDWWKVGSDKFAVATLRSLHSLHSFPDLPDGLTPLAENKADAVHPMKSLRDLTIKEGSDEEASFPWTQTPENKEDTDHGDTSSYGESDTNSPCTATHSYSSKQSAIVKKYNKNNLKLITKGVRMEQISHLATVTPRKQWPIKPNMSEVDFVSDSENTESYRSNSSHSDHSEEIKQVMVKETASAPLSISAQLAVYLGNIPRVRNIPPEKENKPNLASQLLDMFHLNTLIPNEDRSSDSEATSIEMESSRATPQHIRNDISAPSGPSIASSGTATPVLPNEDHRLCLLAMADALESSKDADRLKTFFTRNKSALNTPMKISACSTTSSSASIGFPDICEVINTAQEKREEEEEEKRMFLEDIEPKADFFALDAPKLSLQSSLTLTEEEDCVIEIVSNENGLTNIVIDEANMSHNTLGEARDTPHFTQHTPLAKEFDTAPCCGLQKCLFDRDIVHRYAFLVIVARTMQSWLLLPLIIYFVYVNPQLLGGKQDVAESRIYSISCAPWCTSQSLRDDLARSVVFMQYVTICGVCATLSIFFFFLSSPYLMFATSCNRSAMALLKTGCIYDSIQYFSKQSKCTALEMLSDFNFMSLFFDEIIKRRIPIFYDEDDINNAILSTPDSEILLRSLQINNTAQLAEHVAIRTIKEKYLHLLQFIMYCASMQNENRLMFDPSNCVDEDGNGLLHVAVIGGDEYIIKYILNISGYDPRKNMNNEDVIDLLILHGDVHTLRLLISFFQTECRVDLLKKTFFKSIAKGNMEFVVTLMDALSPQFDTKEWILKYNDMKRTLLMCTAVNGHKNTTEWLLNTVDVDPTVQDTNGKTALMYACCKQNVNVVDIFMKHHSVDTFINMTCNQGISALLYATIEGSLDCVCTLMLENALDTNIAGGKNSETALLHAARYGHQEIAVQLIKAKDINVNAVNDENKTALMFAARYGLIKIVKQLLRHDDIDAEMKDCDGKCALDHVEENIYVGDEHEIIKKIIKAHIISKQHAQNVDPQKLAQKRRSFIMIGELAALQTSNKIHQRYSKTHRTRSISKMHKNKEKKKKRKRRKSVLDLATPRNKSSTKQPVVQLPIDDVEFYLWYSIQMDYDTVCHWLLIHTRCERDLVGRENMEMIHIGLVGLNPFHASVKCAAHLCLRVLLEIDGMDKKDIFVNERDKQGYTPLTLAVMDGKITMVDLLINYNETDINCFDEDHMTPLMHAAIRGYANIVHLLLIHKRFVMDPQYINYVDKKGQTALFLAVRHNRCRVVQCLIHHAHIQVDKARNNGTTPLMCAAKYGFLDIVHMLLSTTYPNHVDLDKKDYDGNTIDFYIQQCKDKQIKQQIMSRLNFYKMWIKSRAKTHLLDETQMHLMNVSQVSVSTTNDDDNDFYGLATKQLEIKKVKNDWNTQLMEIDIEDKLFDKWQAELQILHICAERMDDQVFSVLWRQWIAPHSNSNTMNAIEANEFKREKQHFQSLKWYYFLVMISQKGWHRLFIRFIEEVKYREMKINWSFIPNEQREIDLMAKHEHREEIEEYVKKMNHGNISQSNEYQQISAIKHMKLILEIAFENFGQSAAKKPKLAQCLRFVLSKTMKQYIFNHNGC